MKLIQKTSIAYLILSGIAFLISVILLYFILTKEINQWLDKKLVYSKKEVVANLKYNYPLTTIKYEEIGNIKDLNFPKDTLIFKDTAVYISSVKEFDVFRQLTAYKTIRDKQYKITTRNSLVNNQDFVSAIIIYIIAIISLLLTGLWILNTKLAKNIWQPFYDNLNQLKKFSIQDQEPIKLESSQIDEFQELNGSIKNMTSKLQADFNNLKEFTENASHEMQTPLAIMQSKIELLLQSNNFTQVQTKELHSVYQAGNRLSKLNKALLMLAKVDNQQYNLTEKINLKKCIENKLEIYEDFIENENLTISKSLENQVILSNKTLVDALLSNLISNAIKHNISNGFINITFKNNSLIFSNSGNIPTQDPNNLFNRFKKETKNTSSIGLGLAIVKKICDINNWTIDYKFNEKMHILHIKL